MYLQSISVAICEFCSTLFDIQIGNCQQTYLFLIIRHVFHNYLKHYAATDRAFSFTLVHLYVLFHVFGWSQNWFLFSNFTYLNQMFWNCNTKLITLIHWSSLNFGGVHFALPELCPFTNGKNAGIFCSHSLTLVCLNQMLWNLYIYNACYHETKSSLNFGDVN